MRLIATLAHHKPTTKPQFTAALGLPMKVVIVCVIGIVFVNIWTVCFSIYSFSAVSEILEDQENVKPDLDQRIKTLDKIIENVGSGEIDREGLSKIFSSTKETEIANTNTYLSVKNSIEGAIKVVLNSIFASVFLCVVIFLRIKSLKSV